MSIDSNEAPRQLPDNPNLRHLKNQAVEDLWMAFYDVRIFSAEGAERTFTRFAISAIDGRILGRINKR